MTTQELLGHVAVELEEQAGAIHCLQQRCESLSGLVNEQLEARENGDVDADGAVSPQASGIVKGEWCAIADISVPDGAKYVGTPKRIRFSDDSEVELVGMRGWSGAVHFTRARHGLIKAEECDPKTLDPRHIVAYNAHDAMVAIARALAKYGEPSSKVFILF